MVAFGLINNTLVRNTQQDGVTQVLFYIQ